MDQETQIKRIEDYLEGKLNPEMRESFEKELSADDQLNRLYKEIRYFLDGVEGMKYEQFKNKLLTQSPLVRRHAWTIMKWRYASIAAIILLLLGMYFFLMPSRFERLAKEYYSPPLAQIQRTSVPSEDVLFERGMRAYADGEWEAAIDNFTQVKEGHQLYQRSVYYTAHSYKALKEYDSALSLFQHPDLKQGQYQHQSEWSAALMKMFSGYPAEEFIRDLTIIENNSGHYYNEKARELMGKIERKKNQ